MSLLTEFRPMTTVNGTDFSSWTFYEEDNTVQTFTQGNILELNSSGRVEEASTGVTACVGVAQGTAGGVVDTKAIVWLADKITVFEAAPDTAGDITTAAERATGISGGGGAADIDVAAGVHTLNHDLDTDGHFIIVGGDLDADRWHCVGCIASYWNTVIAAGLTGDAAT